MRDKKYKKEKGMNAQYCLHLFMIIYQCKLMQGSQHFQLYDK